MGVLFGRVPPKKRDIGKREWMRTALFVAFRGKQTRGLFETAHQLFNPFNRVGHDDWYPRDVREGVGLRGGGHRDNGDGNGGGM